MACANDDIDRCIKLVQNVANKNSVSTNSLLDKSIVRLLWNYTQLDFALMCVRITSMLLLLLFKLAFSLFIWYILYFNIGFIQRRSLRRSFFFWMDMVHTNSVSNLCLDLRVCLLSYFHNAHLEIHPNLIKHFQLESDMWRRCRKTMISKWKSSRETLAIVIWSQQKCQLTLLFLLLSLYLSLSLCVEWLPFCWLFFFSHRMTFSLLTKKVISKAPQINQTKSASLTIGCVYFKNHSTFVLYHDAHSVFSDQLKKNIRNSNSFVCIKKRWTGFK